MSISPFDKELPNFKSPYDEKNAYPKKNGKISFSEMPPAVVEKIIQTQRDKVSYMRLVNKTLFIGIICGWVLMLVYTFYITPKKIDKRLDKFSSHSNSMDNLNYERTEQDVSFYHKSIEKRHIFKPFSIQKEQIVVISQDQSAKELAKKLKIVGIILGDEPTVIIEDPRSRETQFMTAGQEFKGAVIEKILEDKVIFRYQNNLVDILP